jgi:hypothetical protein
MNKIHHIQNVVAKGKFDFSKDYISQAASGMDREYPIAEKISWVRIAAAGIGIGAIALVAYGTIKLAESTFNGVKEIIKAHRKSLDNKEDKKEGYASYQKSKTLQMR